MSAFKVVLRAAEALRRAGTEAEAVAQTLTTYTITFDADNVSWTQSAVHEVDKDQELEACKRAEALLLSHLDAKQADEYHSLGGFHVRSERGNQYRIVKQNISNVYRLGRMDPYCVITPSGYPVQDQMLAQKLLLETDEAEFLRLANA